MEGNAVEPFREVNLSDGKCNVSLYVCAEEEKKIDQDPEYASKLFKAALEGKLPSADSESGCADDDTAEDAKEEEEKKMTNIAEWNHEATWVFVNVLKDNIDLLPSHGGSRKEAFMKALKNLTAAGYSFSLECARQKFNSLLTTYKRIRSKAQQDGKVKSRWEFYESMDTIVSELEAIQSAEKNGAVDGTEDSLPDNFKCDLNNDVSAALEAETIDEMSVPVVPDAPETSESHEVVEQLDSGKRKADSLSCSPSSKKQKLDSGSTSPKKNPVAEEVSTSLNGIAKGAEHVVLGDDGFNHDATLLFIECVKEHKDLLKKKKPNEMFSQIRVRMAKEGFSFTLAKLRKKWYNLLISYRRILERAIGTGDLISSWPYYEAIDSIVVDTKALAQSTKKDLNGLTLSPEASTSAGSRGRHSPSLSSSKDRLSFGGEDEEEDLVARGRGNSKGASFFDLLRLKESSGQTSDFEEEDFQRNLLEEWEQREIRREERDKIKVDLLKRIAESMETMTRKQDEMIDLLKGLK